MQRQIYINSISLSDRPNYLNTLQIKPLFIDLLTIIKTTSTHDNYHIIYR